MYVVRALGPGGLAREKCALRKVKIFDFIEIWRKPKWNLNNFTGVAFMHPCCCCRYMLYANDLRTVHHIVVWVLLRCCCPAAKHMHRLPQQHHCPSPLSMSPPHAWVTHPPAQTFLLPWHATFSWRCKKFLHHICLYVRSGLLIYAPGEAPILLAKKAVSISIVSPQQLEITSIRRRNFG